MKFNIKLSNLNVAGMEIGGIEVNTEMSIREVVALREESEHLLENMPRYLEQLAEGYRTFTKLDEEFSDEKYSRVIKEVVKSKVFYADNNQNK